MLFAKGPKGTSLPGKMRVGTGVALACVSLVVLVVLAALLGNFASDYGSPNRITWLVCYVLTLVGSVYILMLGQAAVIYSLFRRLSLRPFWSARPRHAMLLGIVVAAILTSVALPLWQLLVSLGISTPR